MSGLGAVAYGVVRQVCSGELCFRPFRQGKAGGAGCVQASCVFVRYGRVRQVRCRTVWYVRAG